MGLDDVAEQYVMIGCVWKQVADNDKMRQYVTFSQDSLCHKCNGHNLACKNYTPIYTTQKKEETQ